MFTATKIGHTDDIQTQQRIIVIRFSDGTKEFSKPFSFSLTATPDEQKKVVDRYLSEINAVAPTLPDNTTDFKVTDPVQSAADIERGEWLYKHAKYVRVKTTLVDTGIVPLTNPKVQAMIDDLKATLKPEYIDYL